MVPIITRLLTVEEYGRYSVLRSWSNIFFLFATLSICDDGYMVGIKKYYDDKEQFTSAQCSITLLIITGSLMICLIFRQLLSKLLGIDGYMLIIIYSYIYGQFGIRLWSQKNRYDFKYKNVVIATMVIALSTPLLEILLIKIMRFKGLAGDIGANFGYVSVLLALGIPFIIILLKGNRLYDKEYWKYAISFNVQLIPYYLSNRILNQSDRIMIERMVSAESAGLYSIAYSISNLLSFINNALDSTVTPWKYRMLNERKCREISKFTTLEIVFAAILHIMLISIIPELIIVFAGDKYQAAVNVVPSVIIGLFYLWVAQQFVTIELYYEKTKYTATSSSICAVINLITNYLFIPRYGFIAAGYTTLLSYTIYLIMHIKITDLLIKRNELDTPYDKKAVLIICMVSFAMMLFITFLYKYIYVRYAIILILAIWIIIKRDIVIKVLKEIKI
jgi:O-antigen/teichoic acid export membrane protein